jgi:hypothetical protein
MNFSRHYFHAENSHVLEFFVDNVLPIQGLRHFRDVRLVVDDDSASASENEMMKKKKVTSVQVQKEGKYKVLDVKMFCFSCSSY